MGKNITKYKTDTFMNTQNYAQYFISRINDGSKQAQSHLQKQNYHDFEVANGQVRVLYQAAKTAYKNHILSYFQFGEIERIYQLHRQNIKVLFSKLEKKIL